MLVSLSLYMPFYACWVGELVYGSLQCILPLTQVLLYKFFRSLATLEDSLVYRDEEIGP